MPLPGNLLSAGGSSGSSAALEKLETTFGQDLNGDGTIGVPAQSVTVFQTDGSTSLAQMGNDYYLLAAGTTSGVELSYLGLPVTPSFMGTWSPLGAVATQSGYDVAWKNSVTGTYQVWSVNSNGAFTGNLLSAGGSSGSSAALEKLETTFGQDLNGDGTIGVPAPTVTVIPERWLNELGADRQRLLSARSRHDDRSGAELCGLAGYAS